MKRKLLLLIGSAIAVFLIVIALNSFFPEDTEITINYEQPLNQNIQANTIILKIAYGFPEYTPQHRALFEKFVPIVQEGSDWNIMVEVYPTNQLGSEEDYIQGVKNGTVEMCIGRKSLSQLLPELKTLNYPYLFDSYNQANKILNSSTGSKISNGLESMGMRCLAWNINGFRQISTFDDIPEKDMDKKNLKIATVSYAKDIEVLNTMGLYAFPVTDINKLPSLFKQKVIDGYDSTLLTSYYTGFYKDVKNVFITNHIMDTDMYIVSNKFWNKLTSEQKELIERASRESANYEAELLLNYEKDILNTFKEKDIEIKYLDISGSKTNTLHLYLEENIKDKSIMQLLDEIKAEKISANE